MAEAAVEDGQAQQHGRAGGNRPDPRNAKIPVGRWRVLDEPSLGGLGLMPADFLGIHPVPN